MADRVLIVDSDRSIRRVLQANLTARGYQTDVATNGATALYLTDRHPDLLILGLDLPDMDGLAVITRVRATSNVPILVLASRDTHAAVAALDAGADDYVTLPFGMDEFVARVRAALRRSAPSKDRGTVVTRDFVIDPVAKRVTRNNVTVRLTPIQWHLIEILLRNQNQLVTQRELLDEVWGPEFTENTHYLRVFIAQIRQKLEPEPAHPIYFITEPGIGYRFAI
jgi:two-component system, OmpR family, KDP operon response regulator KdpE